MSSSPSNNKPYIGFLLPFSPIATIAIGFILGFGPIFTLPGTLAYFSILGLAYPAVGYFISAYIKLKIDLQKANTIFLVVFISLGLLNILFIITSFPYGLKYQGKLYTYGISSISIVSHIYFFFVIKKILSTQPLENHWKTHGILWFWLSALAFPYMGELI